MAHNDRAYLRAVRESRPQETIAHTPIYCINFVKETQIPAPEASRIPSYSPAQAKPLLFRLTRLGGNLGGRALSTLLALDALGGTLAGGSVLGLLGLLSLLGSGLLLLGVLDGLLASSSTGLRALVAALLDHVEGSTNDSTLGLDGTAGTLLSDFFRDTLLVLATVEDSPGDAAGVLALEEEGLGLSILEAEDLAVATDVQLTL